MNSGQFVIGIVRLLVALFLSKSDYAKPTHSATDCVFWLRLSKLIIKLSHLILFIIHFISVPNRTSPVRRISSKYRRALSPWRRRCRPYTASSLAADGRWPHGRRRPDRPRHRPAACTDSSRCSSSASRTSPSMRCRRAVDIATAQRRM